MENLKNTTDLFNQEMARDREAIAMLERMRDQIEQRIKAQRLVMNNRLRLSRLEESGNRVLAGMARAEFERSTIELKKLINDQI